MLTSHSQWYEVHVAAFVALNKVKKGQKHILLYCTDECYDKRFVTMFEFASIKMLKTVSLFMILMF